MSRTRMNLMLCMVAMVISLVPGQRITSNTKVGASDAKFFLPTSGSSPDLLSGAAGFGLGLAASQIGGNLSTVLGTLEEAAAVAAGRDRLKETPTNISLVLEEEATVGVGGRSARLVERTQNFLALVETIIVEIVETAVETLSKEVVAVVDTTLSPGASVPPRHFTAMERFKETVEAVTRQGGYGATLRGGIVAVEIFAAHQGTLTTHGPTMPALTTMDSHAARIST